MGKQANLKARQGVPYVVQEDATVIDPETMQPVPWDGETMGEVMMRGNITMKGYLDNPEATNEAFEGGWFHSGDLGVVQPDGYIQLRDRAKDIIISGGENISSIEVEGVFTALKLSPQWPWWRDQMTNGAKPPVPLSSCTRARARARTRSSRTAAPNSPDSNDPKP